jgi:hypothetical protein
MKNVLDDLPFPVNAMLTNPEQYRFPQRNIYLHATIKAGGFVYTLKWRELYGVCYPHSKQPYAAGESTVKERKFWHG